MTERRPHLSRLAVWLLCAPLLASGPALAQSLRLPNQAAPARPMPSVAVTADFIVALVNSEPVTNNEVRQRMRRVEQQLAQQGAAVPPREQLAQQVLEQLVSERALLQHATETGIRVDEATLLRAEQSVASQNQLSLEDFRRRVAAEGIDLNRFRSDLRNQILLQRLQERETEARVQVSEADIDDYLRTQQRSNDVSNLLLNLGHVLLLVPEGATAAQIEAQKLRAEEVARRARAGGDFAALAAEFSDAAERSNGGVLGLRQASRLPELFVTSTRALKVGDIAGPLRSEAGFHVLKVLEKRQAGLPAASVVQTRAKHILLRPGPQLTEAAAIERLNRYKQQIAAGQGTFEALAKEHSQDGSAQTGGELGWTAAGQFVPEFEEAMNRLRPGEMSDPVVSRFGVHLIRVEERREAALSQREQRDQVRALLRERKAQDALEVMAREVRNRAYVENREPPRP
jgi:peptidyl-prolyl cis-trans isomerase SurA